MDEEPLRLHIPEPAVRPGASPSFAHVHVPRAGTVYKPPVDVAPEKIRDLAFHSIVRVLNSEGEAMGPWGKGIEDELLLEGLRAMMRTRAYDARMLLAQRQGKTSFYIQCAGEEAIACAHRLALREGDMNFPTYRQQGLLIAGNYPIHDMMCQVYSNSGDPLRGRQLPVMYSARDHGFFSISGNLGTQYIQAVGWAMASALRGDTRIASAWIGDGSTASNDFHSALVYASVYRPPVILNVVNNQWAISSYTGFAGPSSVTFAERAHGYGIASLRVDGNDFLAVLGASRWAADRARGNHGPTLIEWVTYRVAAHSTSDDPSKYRPKQESEAWPLGDPIERLRKHLIRRGLWSDARHAQAEAEYQDEMREHAKKAEQLGTLGKGEGPGIDDMFEGVYKTMPPHLERQRRQFGA